jgi:hypothetical protein
MSKYSTLYSIHTDFIIYSHWRAQKKSGVGGGATALGTLAFVAVAQVKLVYTCMYKLNSSMRYCSLSKSRSWFLAH